MKIDFKWGENYPEEAPEFGLESFYNTHLTDATKEHILEFLKNQAEENLGTLSFFHFSINYCSDLSSEDKSEVALEKLLNP